MWVTGEASVMPYPWQTRIPVSAVKRRASSGREGAAPDLTQRRLVVRGELAGFGGLVNAFMAGGTSGMVVTASSAMSFAKPRGLEARQKDQGCAENQRQD